MRLFTKSLLASALVFASAAPALAAPPYHPGPDHRYDRSERHAYRDGRQDARRHDWDRRHDRRHDWNHRHWNRGDRFDRHTHYVVVNDWRRYHLRRPPPGHYYYRTDAGQILLVAAATGLIISALNS
jgi:Ni/Co efflux regulator RcnB